MLLTISLFLSFALSFSPRIIVATYFIILCIRTHTNTIITFPFCKQYTHRGTPVRLYLFLFLFFVVEFNMNASSKVALFDAFYLINLLFLFHTVVYFFFNIIIINIFRLTIHNGHWAAILLRISYHFNKKKPAEPSVQINSISDCKY